MAAIRAAQLGASVCLVEQGLLGGTCLNRGCIPTKTLLATAGLVEQMKQAATFGVEVDGYRLNLEALRQRKDAVSGQLCQGISARGSKCTCLFLATWNRDDFKRLLGQKE